MTLAQSETPFAKLFRWNLIHGGKSSFYRLHIIDSKRNETLRSFVNVGGTVFRGDMVDSFLITVVHSVDCKFYRLIYLLLISKSFYRKKI